MAPAEGAECRWVAMAASRLELNLVRLLCRCEAMAAEKRDPDEWRLEKYVGALEDMLQALKAQASKPASEVINEYSRKVDFLKGMLQAEKLTSSSEKALANQFLAPGRVPTTARERVPATKTVHLQSRARYTSEMRSELLGTDSTEEPELNVRKRTGAAGPRPEDEKQSAAELDLVLQRHQDLQEKLAEEMLGLARSLKTNTLAAQSVIKKDNQAARRPPPPRGSHDSPRRTHSPARGRPSGAARKPMPTREPLHTCGSRGNLQTHPPGPGPPVSLNGRRAHRLDLGIRIHSPLFKGSQLPDTLINSKS
uniref:Vesicle transport protein USE1 n=1 Tax=Sus scrofa TaxID=9823 RepID=A0A8D0N083_PIG